MYMQVSLYDRHVLILTGDTNQEGPYPKFTDALPFGMKSGSDSRDNDLCWNIELN